MNFKNYFLGLLFMISLIACQENNKMTYSFYHWKKQYNPTKVEEKYLLDLAIDTLFIHYFDVVRKDIVTQPIAKIHYKKIPQQKIIPVVFITNESLKDIDNEEISQISENILAQCLYLHQKTGQKLDYLQLDCDWTPSTKENFFMLCKMLKPRLKRLYATIRLHQVKYYARTGVPPVDKGVIMCYATENPNAQTENSILSLKLLQDYLAVVEQYPLTSDYALPIYSWGVVTNHLGKKKLINNLQINDLENNSYYKKQNKNEFEALDINFLKGIYISKGFKIRIEQISPTLLKDSREFILKKDKKIKKIIYYHLDSVPLMQYNTINLKL